MTIAELSRYFSSYQRAQKRRQQEQASYDYILADLIGRSVSRIYNKSGKMPEIYEAYPSLFESADIEEKRKEQKTQLSILRFKQFANFHNDKLGGANKS